jgi:protein transport protein SEC61 subunit gamma-like protein
MNENSIWFKLRGFIQECFRVLKVTKKPDKIEFMTIVKMSGLGMIIIGLIGFIIAMLKILVFQ